jgi:hypothetical protein
MSLRLPEGRWSLDVQVDGAGAATVEVELGPADARVNVPVPLVPLPRVRITRADGRPLTGFLCIDAPAGPFRGRSERHRELGSMHSRRLTTEREHVVDLRPGTWVVRWAGDGLGAEAEFDAEAAATTGLTLVTVPATVVAVRRGHGWVTATLGADEVVPGIALREHYARGACLSAIGVQDVLHLPPREGLALTWDGLAKPILLRTGMRNEVDLPEE